MSLVGRLSQRIALVGLLLGPLAAMHGAVPLAPISRVKAAAVLSVSPASGPAGAVVTLSTPPGTYPPGAPATVNFQDSSKYYPGIVAARTLAQADGSLNLPVKLPAEASAG